MENHNPNPVLQGKSQGNPVLVRGDYTKTILWKALISSDSPIQALDLVKMTKLSYDKVKSWLDAWAAAGYISKQALNKSETGGTRFVFSAPSQESLLPEIDLRGRYQETEHRNYIWQAIRQINTSDKKVFQIEDVLDNVKHHYDIDVSYDYTQSYLRHLYQAGYFISYHEGISRDPTYSLLHDTGQLAPSIRRGKTVFDGNLGVVVNN